MSIMIDKSKVHTVYGRILYTKAGIDCCRLFGNYTVNKGGVSSAVRRARSFEDAYWSSDNIHERVDLDSDDEDELFLDSDDVD